MGVHSKTECKCRMGVPKKTLPRNSHCAHVLCNGLATLCDLPMSNRRSMLGAVLPARKEAYSSNTGAAFASIVQSNTDLQ
eukprot:11785944-Karenia_brevis.AAC.1